MADQLISLVSQESILETTVDILSDGWMIMAPDHTVMALSPSAERLLGWGSDEARGRECDAVIQALDEQDQPIGISHRTLERMAEEGTDRVRGVRAIIQRRDGGCFPCVMNYGAVRDPDGQVVCFVHTFRDITEEERARQEVERRVAELRRERGTLASVMRSLVDGLCLADDQDQVVYCNPRAEEILDLPAGELVGRSLAALRDRVAARATDPKAVAQALQQALDRIEAVGASQVRLATLPSTRQGPGGPGCGASGMVELVMALPSRRHVCISPFPIPDEQGRLLGRGVLVQDITSERERDELKSQLLSHVSHELRTPLAAIKGSVTTLLQSHRRWDEEVREEFLRIVDEQTDRLQVLLDNLMEMSRLEAGVLRLRKQPLALASLVSKVVETMQPQARRHRFIVDLPPDLPVVEVDPVRIEQVVRNLLENAVKYSPEGGAVTVFGGVGAEEVMIVVRDEGIGIPAEHLERIFDRFYQVDSEVARQAGGSGLGLSICRGIVEAHGGRIWADSTPGQGSIFFFTLPRQAPSVPESQGAEVWRSKPITLRRNVIGVQGELDEPGLFAPAPQRLSPSAPIPGISVLIVEDDPRMVHFVRGNLEAAGYRTAAVADGLTALDAAERENPHLILLDLILPRLDGFEVLRRLRESSDVANATPVNSTDARSGIGVIILTARGDESDKVKGLDLGADDYLTKPFGVQELLARVRAVLRRSRFPEEMRSEPLFVCGDLAIDFAQHRVTVQGREVKLSPTEYKLLYYLASNAGRVLTHETLLHKVWGPEYGGETDYVWVYIRRLRSKIEPDPSQPQYILTEPGVGYAFRRP